MTIQIAISDENWEKLNRMKSAGETFDEVLTRILKEVKKHDRAVQV